MSHLTKSTKARASETETVSHVASAKLDSWKGNSESFMINWKDQTRLHESLVKTDRHLPDDLKKILLENAVKSNSESRYVKDQADQINSQIGR